MVIVMSILIFTLQQMTMMMLNFSHNLHFAPLIHFVTKFILIDKIISVAFLVLKRMFIKFSCNGLSSNIGSDCSFVVDKTFNNWNYVSVLSANVNN